MEKSFALSLNVSVNSSTNAIDLTWGSENNKATSYSLLRYNASTKVWDEIYNGESTSFSDSHNLEPQKTYHYRLETSYWGQTWRTEQSITYTLMSCMKDINVSRGTYNNLVRVMWKAEQVGAAETRYVISRRPINDPTATYTEIHEVNGIASTYSYEDVTALPGIYYMYRVQPYAKVPTDKVEELGSEWWVGPAMEMDGFCQAKGVISGRVTYGTGTAVEGVKVYLEKVVDEEDGTDEQSQYYSIQSTTEQGAIAWTPSASTISNLLQDKPFTIQLWAKSDVGSTSPSARRSILSVPGQLSLYLTDDEADAQQYKIEVTLPAQELQTTRLRVPINSFSNISLASDGNGRYVVSVVREEGVDSVLISANNINWNAESAHLIIGGNNQVSETFKGFVDDVRVWSRTLTSKEILKNHNRILSGAETGLLCYWPLDEGVSNLTYAYDYSKKNGIANGNHARMMTNARPTTVVPSSKQLSLYGLTNAEGSYEIRGIPFSGDGTGYIVRPEMGIHKFNPKFNPKYLSRFININSLTHNGVDLEDISSFPVSGVVYYENTTIPVEGATLYIDGVTASRDNAPIMTDAKGEFKIDVPIGDHYISVGKTGHEFVQGGRYPAPVEGISTTHTFEKELTGLTFYDATLVTIAGRVAGGTIEESKELGLGLGQANIGKAQIILEHEGLGWINAKREVNDLSSSYSQNDQDRLFEQATTRISSSAIVKSGENYLTITTDPKTGEWSAKVPPLRYKATSITIPTQTEIDFSGKLFSLDATNPNHISVDSISADSVFKYCAVAKVIYRSSPHLEVVEHANGAFGLEKYQATTLDNKQQDLTCFTVNETATNSADRVVYHYNYPVYKQLDNVVYKLFAYEEYVNKDDALEPETVRVPLANTPVTIRNEFASTSSVQLNDSTIHEIVDNQFQLNEKGQGEYRFRVGLPNIKGDHTRRINISYELNGNQIAWEKNGLFKAIVIGGLPKGQNFVTRGPDKVHMILRDPPGTGSSATWKQGTSFTKKHNYKFSRHSNTGTLETLMLGVTVTTSSGVGFAVINELESKANVDVGYSINYSEDHGTTTTEVYTSLEDISTSSSADFVGANGDLFIGSSRNYILGACTNVDFRQNSQGEFELGCADAVSLGQEYTTAFTYTQNYIENVLIPQFETLRNGLLPYIENIDINSVARQNETPLYYSKIHPNDERYGSSNSDSAVWGDQAISFDDVQAGSYIVDGPSYYVVLPTNENISYVDTIQCFNMHIKNWQNVLRQNEESKIACIYRGMSQSKNYSFDAGASRSFEYGYEKTTGKEETTTYEHNWHAGLEMGYTFNKLGLKMTFSEDAGMTYVNTDETENTTTDVFAFTLAEEGDDDYLSVDVFHPAPDGFGPIFYTRGGATSAPFEDEVVAKYAAPDTDGKPFVLQQRTLQIEKPELVILNPEITGVPSGKDALLQIELYNNSETDEDCYYGLWVNPNDASSKGLEIYMDGQNIATGIQLLVPADKPLKKTLKIRQSDLDVLDYRDVSLSFYSLSQSDDTGTFPGIYSDQSFSVYYQPSCSDISLEASASVVNTQTRGPITFSMSDYDYNRKSFNAIRLQYKGENDPTFVTLQEFTKDEKRLAADKSLKPFAALNGTDKLTHTVDMRGNDFINQTYVFRALTVGTYNGKEVTTSSQELTIVRDLGRPVLISLPTPMNGVLTANDLLSITFNEDIRSNLLTKVDNFVVTGTLNESQVEHNVALTLSGTQVHKTESTIDLAGKPFSVNMWLNYSHDGGLLRHGTTGSQFSVDIENGKLALTIGHQKVVSTEVLPKEKWLYLSIAYDNSGEKPLIYAGYGKDNETVTLIRQTEVSAYAGNGPIALGGNGMIAYVQELSLWNTAYSLAEALSEKDLTKNQYTDGLIAYWQLNEGHGTVATDRARSRNLTLASDKAWFINSSTNYELKLDGEHAIQTGSSVVTVDGESYLIEAWFKAEEAQVGARSILSTKNGLDIRLNEQGALQLGVNDTYTTTYTAQNLFDGEWHHIALNVLKSTNGSAILYLDGEATRQFAASAMPNLSGSITLGALVNGSTVTQQLKGAIDELRVWNSSRSAEVIKQYMYTRVKANESGLAAYYPMEKRALDEFNQVVTNLDLSDQVQPTYSLESVGGSPKAVVSLLALADAPSLQNVNFNFVASERQITLSLDEQPYRLENCHINITARNIQDKNGNSCQPITWSVYVKQNRLSWVEPNQLVDMTYGEELSFSAEIENNGAISENWQLVNLPSWLTANAESGVLAPLGSQKIRFTVNPGLAVGYYEANLSVLGNQSITSPLHLQLYVNGKLPEWHPVPDIESMAVVGQLMIDGVVSSDTRDRIAAFRGQECVGVASPSYLPRYDAYIFSMTVYGNDESAEQPLIYKVYDASTGIVYPSVTVDNPMASSFASCKLVGSFTQPVLFTLKNDIEQDLSIDRKGWKWFSMYVQPTANTSAAIFSNTSGEVAVVKGISESAVYNAAKKEWSGSLKALTPATMYKLQATEAFKQTVIGAIIDPTQVDITLNSGWNWIGYPAQASNTLRAAFADAAPEEGDIVMSQSSFAIYSEGDWVGSLFGLTPGEGYKYFSNDKATKRFHFQKPASNTLLRQASVQTQEPSLTLYCEDNMAMIAKVMRNGEVVTDAIVSIYDGMELVGYSDLSDVENRHFITIGGTRTTTLLDVVVSVGDEDYRLPATLSFRANEVRGSLQKPFQFEIGSATSIEELVAGKAIQRIDLYNTNGIMIKTVQHPTSLVGGAEMNDLADGIYVVNVLFNDGSSSSIVWAKRK